MHDEGHGEDSSSKEEDESRQGGALSTMDKFWVAFAIALFILLFVAIFIFGVY
jgi:hypothetical protein